ncbi:MAG: hypothetical protein IJ136_07310 [Erysipelotrichaceae bacterium]|nr:hypothetical protein [Erysipelotrichaceae bacterium]
MELIRTHLGDIITILCVVLLLHVCARSLFGHGRSKGSCACSGKCATCALRYVHGMEHKV